MPRRISYFALALAGALCLYGGLKLHRHVTVEGDSETERLTVGLAGSPLFIRTTGGPPAEGFDATQRVSVAWHPISGSAVLVIIGLGLLITAGAVRKSLS